MAMDSNGPEAGLKGRVIVVTGAGRGLGRTYAERFAAEGARIVALDLRPLAETEAAVLAAGAEVLAQTCDVTDMASLERMAAAVEARFGRVDGLVNNAALYGGLTMTAFEKLPEAEWDAAMAVNVKGVWQACKAVLPLMRAAGGGSIVNIASLAATYGMPNALHYTASKAAVIGLTRGMAREVGRHEIRVNAVAPTMVPTESSGEFFGERLEKGLEVIRAGQAVRRTMQPGDLVATVRWLLAPGSEFVTGQTIAVDGGTVFL